MAEPPRTPDRGLGSDAVDPGTEATVGEFADRVDNTYRQAAANGWAGAIAAGCLFAVMLPHSRTATLLVWLAATLGSIAIRRPLVRAFQADEHRRTRARLWARRYAVAIAAHGFAWGIAALLFLDDARPLGVASFLIVLTPLVAGSIASQSFYLPSVVSFVSLALLPAVGRLLSFNGEYLPETATLVLFYLFLLSNARTQNARIREANLLRRSNAELIERLREEKLESDSQRARAEAAIEAKARFVAMAGHDLRQPMHALGLFAGSLKEATWDQGSRHLVDRILVTLDALQALVNEFLELSRLESGHVEIGTRHFATGPLFDRIAAVHAPAARAKGLRVESVGGDSVLATDPVLLERLLGNLVQNAVRYTERGTVSLTAAREGAIVRIAVRDTGPGIPEPDRERVFEEFVRLSGASDASPAGMGLGLPIVRRIATLLGLRLSMASEIGSGTTFSIDVPAGDAGQVASDAHSEAGARDLLHGCRIHVVDDDENVLSAMAELLTRWGCTVRCDADVETWLEGARQSGPDIVIADVRLRGPIDGFRAIDRLREASNREVPALVMTADLTGRAGEEAGARNLPLLHKPVRPASLRAALTRLAAGKSPAAAELQNDRGRQRA